MFYFEKNHICVGAIEPQHPQLLLAAISVVTEPVTLTIWNLTTVYCDAGYYYILLNYRGKRSEGQSEVEERRAAAATLCDEGGLKLRSLQYITRCFHYFYFT